MAAKQKTARPVFPNAGVEKWYQAQLQTLVREMSQDMLDAVRRAWRDGGGIAQDAAPPEHWAAGIIFRTPDGRVLLCHRTDGTHWAYPGGGIEPGETPAQAARRECYEELRYTVLEHLQWLHIRQYPRVQFATFLCDLADPFVPSLNSEHSAYQWVTPDEALRTLSIHPGARETLEWLAQAYAMDARPKPSTSLLLQRSMLRWGGQWSKRLDRASDKIALAFATKSKGATEAAMMKTLADAGFTVRFKPTKTIRQAYDAVVAENIGLIRSIPQRYLADVQNVVWQGVMQGSDLATMADQLQEKYGIAHRRAALIARDQNHKAKAAIERARRLEVGITSARWRHSHAGKDPRPTHVKMNGKEYDITKGMYDSAVKKYIWPGTEINCRCTDEAVIPGFK